MIISIAFFVIIRSFSNSSDNSSSINAEGKRPFNAVLVFSLNSLDEHKMDVFYFYSLGNFFMMLPTYNHSFQSAPHTSPGIFHAV